MTLREPTKDSQATRDELLRLHMAGQQCAKALKKLPPDRDKARALDRRVAEVSATIRKLETDKATGEKQRQWLRENHRLIRTAMRESKELGRSLQTRPLTADESGTALPRAYMLSRDYVVAALDRFSEEGLQAFCQGYQTETEIDMSEIWALKPAVQFAILERLAKASPEALPNLIDSLRDISEAQWKDLFEEASIVHHLLVSAPNSEYGAMDYASRDLYRNAISRIARNSSMSEHQVTETAIELSARPDVSGRRATVGYYLLDSGVPELEAKAGFKRSAIQRFRQLLIDHPNAFYLIGIELATLGIVYSLLSPLDSLSPIVAGFFLLLLPATQAAVDFMNNLTGFLVSPRVLPKLDFSKGIPEEASTMVAVPTLLMNEAQVHDLVLDLEIRFLANRDPHLCFALVTDSPDSDAPAGDDNDALVDVCEAMIDALNKRYGTGDYTPFYLFHRHRIFNASEGRWMGWERKRGKLLDLNQFLRGGFDSFPVKVGNLTVLHKVRYVITLDSDTQLPRDAAARLIGTLAHPLNRAVVDPASRMVVEGYGILQPRIGVSIQSAVRSRLAAIYSGQTGFDIYTRAVSDVYQDLFGEGIFTGKGIYDVDALEEALGQRFPENALLSHDLIEGSYARAGLVSDIELIDDYPSHFSAYSRRKHRWVRGDWQIMRWLLPRVPDYHNKIVPNPINLISRWKILDNLRRSLFEPATLALLIAGWFYLPGNTLHWTGASVGMWLMPVYANLLFSLIRAPWGSQAMKAWAHDLWKSMVSGHVIAGLGIVFLLHQSLLSLDAIGRSVARVFVTRRRLLEWETAAEAESAGQKKKSTVDTYLEWSPYLAVAIGTALYLVRPGALPVAAPILVLWFASRGISAWLNRAPRTTNKELSRTDVQMLTDLATRILRFYHDWSTEQNHFLIPDNIREDGAVAARLSPTNIGFLLNAEIVSVLFNKSTLEDYVTRVQRTLATIAKLTKYRGHLLNWYDTDTLEALHPKFVSTVDSGNLVACFWTLKQASLCFANEAPAMRGVTAALSEQLRAIAATCDALVDATDFSFLYHARKKVLSVGYDTVTGQLEPSSYDLLASEARIACFVAIAKGDIPQEAWFHLGRRHVLVRGARILASWTGTMFEYLMPALWMRHYPGTILQDSLEAAVRIQQDYARRKGIPWGISESACSAEGGGGDYGYAAFGVPDCALKSSSSDLLVISPYSTLLALPIDPRGAMENLRRMEEFGWSGRYGFYEAVDYTHAGGTVITSWMAHHQGMSLLAICNLLMDNPIPKYFHAEPRVLATELLLNERVPTAVVVEAEESVPAAAA